MSSIDNRVVKMSFNNEEFEKKVGTTLETLEKLKSSLNFSGATKGMEEIEKTANTVDFSALTEGVQALQSRFSVLGEFVHNTFMNMVNSAVDAGKRIADALITTPVKEGFAEYELQMGAIQTILAGAKTNEGLPVTLDLVNQKLDELNEYADKTIYSFSDMTQNIGKFTNAGVGLEDAVAAIQGVSNVAAISGANTQQASHAMYNFAQALSSGYVKLIDWKSIETANMATVGFKDTLIQTGLAMGTLVKEGDKYRTTTTNAQGKVSELFDETVGFNDALQNQWMTTDVLTQALKIYSTNVEELSDTEKEAYEKELEGLGYNKEQIKDLEELGIKAAKAAKDVKTFSQLIDTLKEALGSGWTKSWQYVIGDFEEAKKLWTDINDVLSDYINKSSDARNAMLKEWSEGGGRKALIDSLWNSFNALVSIMTPIKEAWNSIFPAVKAKDLIKYSEALRDFTAGLKLTDEEGQKLKITMMFIFSFLKTGMEGVIGIGKSLFAVLKTVGSAIGEAFGSTYISRIGMLASRFKEFSEIIKPSETTLANFGKLIKGIASVVRAFLYIAVDAGSALFDAFEKLFVSLAPEGESFMDLLGKLGDWLSNLADKMQSTFNFDTWSGGFGSLADALLNLWEAAKNFLNLDGVIEWFKNFFDVTKGSAPSIDLFGTLTTLFGKLTSAFADFTSKIDLSQLDIGKVLNLAANVALFKKIYQIFQDIEKKLQTDAPKNWLTTLKDTFVNVFEGIGDLLITFKNSIIDVVSAIEKEVKADVFKKVAISFAIMVASLWVLSTIDTKKLATAVAGLTALMVEVGALMTYISGLKFTNLKALSSASDTLIKIGAALLILAAAVRMIGSMEPQQVSEGILAVTILLAEMAAVAKMFSNMDMDLAKGATSLILFAVALRILVGSVKELGEMDPTQLLHGMEAVLTLLASLVIVSKKLDTNLDPSQLKSVATGLVIFSIAIKVLASVVKDFASLNLGQLATGLGGLIALVVMLVYTARNIPTDFVAPEQIIKVSAGLLIFSAAVKVLASVVKDFASLNLGQLAIGLGGLAGIMFAMVLAAEHLDDINPKTLAATALGLMLVIGTVKSLADVAIKLSTIPYDQISNGLGSLAVIMIALGVAAAAFSAESMNPARIAGVAAGLLIFSLAVGAMAASLKLLSTIPWQGLLASLGAIVALFVIVGGATAILGPLVPVMISLAGAFALFGLSALAFGAGVALAATGIATLVAAVAAGGMALAEIGRQFLDLFAKAGEAFANMFVGFITTLAAQGPVLVGAIAQIIQSVLTAIMETIPMITQTLFTLLSELLAQLATYVPQMAQSALQIIGAFLEAIAANLPTILNSAITIGVEFINGIAQKLPEVIDAAFNLIISFVNGVAEAINNNHDALWSAVGNLITAIVDALLDGIPKVVETGGQILSSLINTISETRDKMITAGLDLVQGFVDGLLQGIGGVWEAACNLATTAWNAITGTLEEHSPSRLTYTGGENFVQGFIDGINSKDASDSASNMAQTTLSAFIKNLGNANSIGKQASAMMASFTSGIMSGIDGVRAASTNVVSRMSQVFSSSVNKVKTTASTIMRGFTAGISGAIGEISNIATSIITKLTSAFSTGVARARSIGGNIARAFRSGISTIGNLYSYGRNAMAGFFNGVASMGSAVVDKARAIAASVKNTISNALHMHSPSRDLFEMGVNTILGFLNGMDSLSNKTTETMTELAETVQNTFEAIENIDSDYTPVVTPVVDLTEINGAVHSIDMLRSMFDIPVDVNPVEHTINHEISSYIDWNKQALSDFMSGFDGIIDYNQLGQAVAAAMIDSGLHVELDGGQMVGYLASNIRDVRRMYA